MIMTCLFQLGNEVGTAGLKCADSNTWLNNPADDGGDNNEEDGS